MENTPTAYYINDGENPIPVTGSQWYILYPCYNSDQPVVFTHVTEFAQYVNGSAEVYAQENTGSTYYLGCYTVKLFLSIPPSYAAVYNNIYVTSDYCGYCESACIAVGGGNGYVKYINYDDVEITTSLPAKICTKSEPFVSISTPIITEISSYCSAEEGCDISCYVLTNCATGQVINSNNQSLFTAYANQSTISLNELDGCWTVDIGSECECFEDVSINLIYSSCETCLPVVAYVLTNCENELLKKYSQEDLAIYVGKIVSLDCGDCWYVDQIDFKPPQTQTFVVENAYDSCDQCSRAYWVLYDCAGDLEPITTFTDMTQYVNSIVKLAGFSSCWSIQSSPTPDYENAVGVSVSKEFEDCPTCLAVAGCTCTRVTNTASETLTYTYKDCSGMQESFTLASGATSVKFCVNQWILKHPDTDVLNTYGDCIEDPNNSSDKICPIDITGRMMKPGYSTPNCDTEKFERITCATAEVLYKQVLQQRYGISNCCPEDDENLILKKEVIDFQSLHDPNFNCTEPLSCCTPSQCNCGNCISQ